MPSKGVNEPALKDLTSFRLIVKFPNYSATLHLFAFEKISRRKNKKQHLHVFLAQILNQQFQ